MRRVGFAATTLSAFGAIAVALQSPELQQKAAAAKEAAAQNQQALRSYSWITKTELSVKGEVKNTKIESCQYGPDGTVQKTELTDPLPPPKKQRGLKGRIIAKKTGEMKEELEAAAALVQSYVPPSPEKIQAVIAAGKLSLTPGGAATAIRFADYEKGGDALTLTLDSASKSMQQISVDTWLDKPENKVTLAVTLQSLPDGTSYPASTVLSIPKDHLEVRVENSNYQKLAP
ncbi:MAG TPA: hypothetical protein VEK15_02105 [Vicinamibacteria bacterium]|nr:hypothetical protein [Vicinamibacteria bacterium]